MDRQDIDALLIGALYGELTPADEARLAAHLESHPADKTALDDLRSAREQVKQSRIFELQSEPPQAISAVLLQEAARRAPKRVVASEQPESWFHRFVRSFAAHPAMAAAAMLVLVVGVAATLYMKNGNVGYEKTAGQSEEVAATNAPVATPPVAEPAAKDQAAAGSAAYQVGLDEGQLDRKEQVAERQQETEKKTAEDKAPERAKLAQTTTPPATATAKADSTGAYEQKPAAHATPKSKKGTGYLEVVTPQQMPKELPDTADGEAYAGDQVAQKQAGPSGKFATAPGSIGGGAPTGAASGGVASAAPQQPAPAPQVAAAPPPPPPPADYAKNAPSKAATKPAPAKTVSKAPAPKAEAAPVEATRGDTDLIAWAKRQHAAAIAKVKAGDCGAAAALAVNVRSQAYGYYQQNMANDRELKGCASYIANAVNREEERASKSKAAKSAPDEAPAATQSK
ncbi:MAG TPA: hypothetical protein VLT45_11095 [Kofleriaceae bacterium]|nr:hypothetical protein [Kofleriaceae bacterium]